jgi:dolichyl-phosphate-mannose-protein mannosyltransferase
MAHCYGKANDSNLLRMRSLLLGERSWPYYSVLILAAYAFVLGLWARLYRLGFPPRRVFDEIYFPIDARSYLQGVGFFDPHPPLGKFIIAISIAALGDDPVGWRLMPALFGCAMIGLGAVLGWYFTKQMVGALLMGAFVAAETIFIAYSRTGLLDGMLAFFVMATMLLALRARTRKQVIWVAVLLGLTISIKWAALPVALPAGYLLWRKGLLRQFVGDLYVSATIYLLIVYVGQLIRPTGGGERLVEARGLEALRDSWVLVWEWHLQALRNVSMSVPHPEASPWWSWPLMLQPIHLFTRVDARGFAILAWAIGNPVLWWSSTLAIILSFFEIVRRKFIAKAPIADHPLLPVLIGYLFLLLPWVLSSRIPFIYNYFPSYVFALLALVYWSCQIWKHEPWGQWVVVALVACVSASAGYFLPMTIGLPMSAENMQDHMWLETWRD